MSMFIQIFVNDKCISLTNEPQVVTKKYLLSRNK